MKNHQLDFSYEGATGRKCELCHCPENAYYPLSKFYLDLDVSNTAPENIALLCPPCFRHVLEANPEGIRKARVLFAFLINRGLYTREQLTGRPARARSINSIIQ